MIQNSPMSKKRVSEGLVACLLAQSLGCRAGGWPQVGGHPRVQMKTPIHPVKKQKGIL